ncbi:MurR/RpiR family transcriptional regulator [Ideonella dechloratans]|uniref:MurR/RpiR family transcriptional regulator n=1 Tax=Ideonella dechloratans TaxID=36863 RepID=UPI0035B0C415
MSLTDQIQRTLSTLPAAEQRVAQAVLADPRATLARTVAELAGQARVSNPTVVRFCRSLGFAGWADFKLKLAGNLGQGLPYVHKSVAPGDGSRAVVDKIVEQVQQTLADFRQNAGLRPLEQASQALVRTIRAGRRIEFYGVGNSGIVAQDAQHKFFRMGCHTAAYADGHLQVMGATLLQPEDCVVVFSNSGRSRDLLDATELARQQKATTVAITASGSPLAAAADIHIAADHPESYEEYSPMVSRLLHLVIVDILATEVALQLGPDLPARLHALKRNLRAKRYRNE